MINNPETTAYPQNPRRYTLLAVFGLLTTSIAACNPNEGSHTTQGKSMSHPAGQDVVYFSVNLYSYLDRPIFDVRLNGRDIGVAGGQPHRGRGGIITGVPVPLGPQSITWRLDGPKGMPGNGDTVSAINTPVLERPDPKFTYLGVHIYPDNTVEIVPEQFWPEKTEKGQQINRQWELLHGK